MLHLICENIIIWILFVSNLNFNDFNVTSQTINQSEILKDKYIFETVENILYIKGENKEK